LQLNRSKIDWDIKLSYDLNKEPEEYENINILEPYLSPSPKKDENKENVLSINKAYIDNNFDQYLCSSPK